MMICVTWVNRLVFKKSLLYKFVNQRDDLCYSWCQLGLGVCAGECQHAGRHRHQHHRTLLHAWHEDQVQVSIF